MDASRYSEDGFNAFLSELIDTNRLSDIKEEGIAKRVIDKGFESLSDKQKYVFGEAISHYVYETCKRCGLEIPWCEMSAAEDNGEFCSWCQQLSSHDD